MSTSASATIPRQRSQVQTKPPRRRVRHTALRLLVDLVVLGLLVVVIYPLFWLVTGSFKTQNEFINQPIWSLPSHLDWSNYTAAWTTGHMGLYLRNSLTAVLPSLALIVILGVAAGFALEIMVFRGRASVLLYFLLGIMIPGQMILLPLFSVYFRLGLTGSLWPLIITYTATGLPLTVFMMATFFRSVPREVFEAATIDGASMLKSFLFVGVPIMRNAIFTVALVQFFFCWNDLLIALTFVNNSNLATVQVGLLNFTGQFGAVQWGPLFAAICINVFLLLIIYLFLNQRMMRGLTAGSVKG